MSREKQIEEMAKVMCIDCAKDTSPCRVAKEGRMCESVLEQAEALYNAGYRKQSEVEKTVLSKAASKFAGHSDYHGDTILQVLYCMAEGKEVNDAKPLEHEAMSEGEWIAQSLTSTSKRGRKINYSTYKCSVCGTWNGRHRQKYCHECGAKMKGGAE